MKTPRQRLGDRGEDLAARFLRRKGHKLLARKYRCRAGEVDLISLEPRNGCICFVEVKTAADDGPQRPEDQVNRRKRARLIAAARDYLKAKHAFEHPIRFDVIAVLDAEAREPQIRHWPDAFRLQ
jgi:putative endonuclease